MFIMELPTFGVTEKLAKDQKGSLYLFIYMSINLKWIQILEIQVESKYLVFINHRFSTNVSVMW